MGYTITLLVFTIIAHSRGQTSWLATVRDGFGPVPEKPVIMTTAPVQQAPVSSVPYNTQAPQTTYYPQQQQVPMSVARAEV